MIRAPDGLGRGQWPNGVLEHVVRSRSEDHRLRTYRTLRTNLLSNTPKPTDTKTERFELRLSSDLLARVDEWRRNQPDLPSRSEAFRRLVEAGLASR